MKAGFALSRRGGNALWVGAEKDATKPGINEEPPHPTINLGKYFNCLIDIPVRHRIMVNVHQLTNWRLSMPKQPRSVKKLITDLEDATSVIEEHSDFVDNLSLDAAVTVIEQLANDAEVAAEQSNEDDETDDEEDAEDDEE